MTVTREEALEIFARRRATRAYDPDRRISDEDFAAILEFARLSPSSVGTEPWKFLVIQDPELREKLKPIAWGMAGALDDASHLVVLLAKKGLRYDTPWMRRTLEGRNLTEEQMQAALERYGNFQKNDMKILEDDRALFDGKQGDGSNRNLDQANPAQVGVFANGFAVAKFNNWKTDGTAGPHPQPPPTHSFLFRAPPAPPPPSGM